MLKKSLLSLVLILAILLGFGAPLAWAGPTWSLNLETIRAYDNTPWPILRVKILPDPPPYELKVQWYAMRLDIDSKYEPIATTIMNIEGISELNQKMELGAYSVYCEADIDGVLFKSNPVEFTVNPEKFPMDLVAMNPIPDSILIKINLPDPPPPDVWSQMDIYIKNIDIETGYKYFGSVKVDSEGMFQLPEKLEPGVYSIFCKGTIDGIPTISTIADFSVNTGEYITDIWAEYHMPMSVFIIKNLPRPTPEQLLEAVLYLKKINGGITYTASETTFINSDGTAEFKQELMPGTYRVYCQTKINAQTVTTYVMDYEVPAY